ncbi:glycosyltransferase family 39 protein [Phormidium nigroviride]
MTVESSKLKIANGEKPWFHSLLLLTWIAIGTVLRFTNLAGKPPSTIEIATIVFSLGNSLQTIPLDSAIALDALLQPLQLSPEANITSVIHNLMTESTHPPVYFVLAHWWMKLFSNDAGLVFLWAARALPAILGVASIPAMFCFGFVAFRSRLIAQMAAAMMAVSPYGIFIAQEARHYTLPVLLIIASLGYLAIATRTINERTVLPIWVGLSWVGVNCLGIATHYFFILVVAAEGLSLIAIILIKNWRYSQEKLDLDSTHNLTLKPQLLIPNSLFRIYAVAAGTLVGCLVWVPALETASDSEMTRWIYEGKNMIELLEPAPRILAWMVTMLALLPVEGVSLSAIVISGLILLVFMFFALPILIQGIKIKLNQSDNSSIAQVLCGFILAAISIFLGITYILGADLTLAARYQFVYFPAIIILFAVSLAIYWEDRYLETNNKFSNFFKLPIPVLKIGGRKAVTIILLMGLLGSITVVANLGFQKSKRPDILVPQIVKIQEASPKVPVLIAMVRKSHSETRAMMGIAWEFKRLSSSSGKNSQLNYPQFLLAKKDGDSQTATDALHKALAQMPKPLDLWTINFTASVDEKGQNCVVDSVSQPKIAGYKYRLYHCL